MVKYLIMSLLLVCACSTPARKNRDAEFEFRLKTLEHLNLSHSYIIDLDRCFIDYLMCKSKTPREKKCWATHEQCVTTTYLMYEQLKKKSGG